MSGAQTEPANTTGSNPLIESDPFLIQYERGYPRPGRGVSLFHNRSTRSEVGNRAQELRCDLDEVSNLGTLAEVHS